MQFKSKAAQREWSEHFKSTNEHTLGTLRYAERLADIVEASSREAEPQDDLFFQATLAADAPEPVVITIVMYSFAVQALVKSWLYGEQLKAWHNQFWAAKDISFKSVHGILAPCFVENRTTRQYATIVAAYVEFVRLSQPELKRLANQALFSMAYPKTKS